MKLVIVALAIALLFNTTHSQCLNIDGNITCPNNCQCCSTPDTCSQSNSTSPSNTTQLVDMPISNCTHCTISYCARCFVNPALVQKCNTCQEGYGVMVRSKTQCLFCSESNAQSCRNINNCDQGTNNPDCAQCQQFYVDPLNKCSKCSETYRSCLTCNQNQCTFCKSGYYLNTTNNKQCVPCTFPYCRTCQNGPICTSCLSGFYLDSSRNCQICSYPCEKCDINGCLSCAGQNNQYLLLSNGTCILCLDFSNTANCSSCIQTLLGYKCLACQEKFYLDGIVCSPCTSPCRTCNSSTQCSTCLQSYYFNVSANTCDLCNTSITNCHTCFDENVCLNCTQGFVVFFSANKCTPCFKIFDNCDNCTHQECRTCMLGFYMTGISCLPNLDCSSNCLSCEILNKNACFTCFDGYYLQNISRTCMPCSDTCSQCTSDTFCIGCNDGYFLNGSACLICPNGTYYLNTIQSCLNCSSYCLTCSVTACITCESSLFSVSLLTGQCEDICGDGYALTLPCDNGIGIENDGCSDSCQIEENFNCTYINASGMNTPSNILVTTSQCSYIAEPVISAHKVIQSIYSNNIQLVFQVKPYLLGMPTGVESQVYLRQFFQLSPIDSLADYIISVNPQEGTVSFDISYSSDISKSSLTLSINYSSLSTNPIYQYLSYQQKSMDMSSFVSRGRLGQYYQENEYNINKLLFVIVAILVGLSYLTLFLGLFSRQLAGLQHMLLCQTIYLLVFFSNHSNFYLEGLLGLKYSISIDIFNSQPGNISDSPGYLYSINAQSFMNNFNINFFLLLLPAMIAPIFMLYRIKNKHLPVKSDFGKTASQLLIGEMLLYFVVFNYYGFVAYSYLFFQSQQKQQIINMIVIVTTAIFTLFAWSSLFLRPQTVGIFRWAFSSYKTYIFYEPQKSKFLKILESCLSCRINAQKWKDMYRLISINFYYILLAYQIVASFFIIYSLHLSLFLSQATIFIILLIVKPYLKPAQKFRSLFTFSILMFANFINYLPVNSVNMPILLICLLTLHLSLTAYIVIKASYLQFTKKCMERSELVRKMFKQDPELRKPQKVQEQIKVINDLIREYHNLNISEKFQSIKNGQIVNEEPEECKDPKQEVSDNEYMLTEQRILGEENKHLRYVEGMGFINKYGFKLNQDIIKEHYVNI